MTISRKRRIDDITAGCARARVVVWWCLRRGAPFRLADRFIVRDASLRLGSALCASAVLRGPPPCAVRAAALPSLRLAHRVSSPPSHGDVTAEIVDTLYLGSFAH
jgi:hypothetical protein